MCGLMRLLALYQDLHGVKIANIPVCNSQSLKHCNACRATETS